MEDVALPGVVGEIARLAGLSDPEAAAAGYRQAVRDAYWEAQDLGAVTSYASAGYAHCLSAAAAAVGGGCLPPAFRGQGADVRPCVVHLARVGGVGR